MGFDGLVVLMVDRTDVKVGLQCLKNGLDPSYDVVILPDLLLVPSVLTDNKWKSGNARSQRRDCSSYTRIWEWSRRH